MLSRLVSLSLCSTLALIVSQTSFAQTQEESVELQNSENMDLTSVIESAETGHPISAYFYFEKNKAKRSKFTLKRRAELIMHGTITDDQGKVWRIRVVPGISNANHAAFATYRDAGQKIGNLFDKEYYKRNWNELRVEQFVRQGVKHAPKIFVAFKDATWGTGKQVGSWIAGDWKNYRETTSKLWDEKPIGWFLTIPWHTGGFVTKAIVWDLGVKGLVGRTAIRGSFKVGEQVMQTTLNGTVAIAATAGMVGVMPVAAALDLVGGTADLALGYPLTVVTWTGSQIGNVPTHNYGWVIVRDYKREETLRAQNGGNKINSETLGSIILANLYANLTEDQKSKIAPKAIQESIQNNLVHVTQGSTEESPVEFSRDRLYNVISDALYKNNLFLEYSLVQSITDQVLDEVIQVTSSSKSSGLK